MKKECEQTRKNLRRYLRGHVFATERKRIERHLAACPLCATECQSLKRADETTQFLKDITPPEGVVQKVKTGVSGLSAAKKILYRPLWIVVIAAAGFALYSFVVRPYLREQEQEWQELTAPSAAPAPPVPAAPPAAEPKKAEPAAPPAARNADPLVVTITVEDEQSAVRRINEVMRGHGVLRAMRFSDTVREISASLTAKELLTFFNRIESVGKIGYSRSRLEAFPSAEPLPFVMKLKAAPPRAALPGDAPARAPAEAAAPKPAAPPAPAEQSVPKAAAETPPAR